MSVAFITLINAIIERPAMYTVNNVEDINLVIFGYLYAVKGKEGKELNDLLLSFRKYVQKEFKIKGDPDWPRVIRFCSGGDKHSIELFAQTFQKFLSIYK